jgi:hypothetical protein
LSALPLAASLAFLLLAADGSARSRTTAPGSYLTVRVSVTNKGITMSPTHARYGQTAIFLLSNRAAISRVFALGDVSLTHHRGAGFAVKLGPHQQTRILLYLTYRGVLPAWLGTARKTKVVGAFRVT